MICQYKLDVCQWGFALFDSQVQLSFFYLCLCSLFFCVFLLQNHLLFIGKMPWRRWSKVWKVSVAPNKEDGFFIQFKAWTWSFKPLNFTDLSNDLLFWSPTANIFISVINPCWKNLEAELIGSIISQDIVSRDNIIFWTSLDIFQRYWDTKNHNIISRFLVFKFKHKDHIFKFEY